jgi:hypothetical protein
MGASEDTTPPPTDLGGGSISIKNRETHPGVNGPCSQAAEV